MTQHNASDQMQKVLEMRSRDAASWLSDALKGQAKTPADFNWEGLASAASTLSANRQDSGWAALGAAVREHLAERSVNCRDTERHLLSAMQFQVVLISHFQVQDSAARVERVLSWFRARLTMSIEEAKARSSMWEQLPTGKILELRDVKNRLNVLVGLEQIEAIRCDRELSGWLAIRSLLP